MEATKCQKNYLNGLEYVVFSWIFLIFTFPELALAHKEATIMLSVIENIELVPNPLRGHECLFIQ